MNQYQSRFYVLESLLNDILSLIKPLESDHYQRQDTISQIYNVAQSVTSLKDVVIRPFGSFVSNLYTKWGDLDISLELSHVALNSAVEKHKQNLLRDLMIALRRHGVARSFTFLPQARVPVLKFQTDLHNISCDVSVDNHTGWMKSRILMQISEIDERFRDIVLLTKEWAKAQDINDPKTGSLNSYSLCLLVVFHFQTCSPAILPPLKDIDDGNFVDATGPWSRIEMRRESACATNIARFKARKQRNHSSICELLVSFFDKFSNLESIASDTVVSTYTGRWQKMVNNPRWMDKSHFLLVEDPFERPDNAARAVSLRGLDTISEAFRTTFRNLSTKRVLLDRNLMVDILLRQNINSQLKAARTPKLYSASKSQERPYTERNGYALPNVHHIQYQNNQKPNIPRDIGPSSGVGTSNHYTATRSPNPLHIGYVDAMPSNVRTNYTSNRNSSDQIRNNGRSGSGATHYAVSAYIDNDDDDDDDDDDQSQSYSNSWGTGPDDDDRIPKLCSAPYMERHRYALPNRHHIQFQNNQKSNIPRNIGSSSGVGTSYHYTATRSPNPSNVRTNYTSNRNTNDQIRNNGRSGSGATNYAVSAYLDDDDDNESQSYNNSSGTRPDDDDDNLDDEIKLLLGVSVSLLKWFSK